MRPAHAIPSACRYSVLLVVAVIAGCGSQDPASPPASTMTTRGARPAVIGRTRAYPACGTSTTATQSAELCGLSFSVNERDLTASPREDSFAEMLALELGGSLLAEQSDYERVACELPRLKSLAPWVFAQEPNGRYRYAFRFAGAGLGLMLRVDDETWNSLESGGDPSWMCLTERLRATVERYEGAITGRWVFVAFEPILNTLDVLPLYTALQGVEEAYPDSWAGGYDEIRVYRDEGERHHYVVGRGVGDCPAGCAFHHFHFIAEREGAVTLAHRWSAGDGPPPEWILEVYPSYDEEDAD